MKINTIRTRTLSRLALGASSFAILAAGAAQAQQGTIVTDRPIQVPTQVAQATPAPAAEEAPLEEIIVSGFRKSLFDSVQAKRNATQIVEAISAEDIGKLPDNSIAESLARLPGLTSQRVDGRSQTISLRGLGPDFTTTLLNGREQASVNNNRSTDFDQYPSELIEGVTVYKSSNAGVLNQGLAGTIDLRTIRPLDRNERVIALSLRGELTSTSKLNADSDRAGYRFSGIYVDQFANDTLGIQIGVSLLDQPTQIKDARIWGYPNDGGGGPENQAITGTNRVIGGAEIKANSLSLKRTGITGAIDFEPNDNFKTSLDLFYSKFEDDQIQRGIETPLTWGYFGPVPTRINNDITVEDGLVTSGSFRNVKAVLRSDLRSFEADIFAAGWNGTYTKDGWTFAGDVSYNTIDRESERLEIYSGTGRAALGATDTIRFQQNTNDFGAQFTPTLNYADPNLIRLTSPQGWGGDVVPGGQDGYANRPEVKDDLLSFRFDVDKEFDRAITRVKFAVNYTTRDKEFQQNEAYLALRANQADPLNRTSVAIPQDALIDPTDLSFFGIGDVVAFDTPSLLAANLYTEIACPRIDCLVNRWELSEDVWTGMARADFDTGIGSWNLSGNIGAQVVYTDQSSIGPAVTGVNLVSVREDGDKYTDILPSLNLIFTPPNDDHKIRLALSRQMARARPDQLRASATVNFNEGLATSTDPANSPWSGNGGNPRLQPWIANSVDLSYENYFSDAGLFAVAGFYKDLRTYIYNQNILVDFTGFQFTGTTPPVLNVGGFSAPANGEGGEIYGLEASLTLPFEDINERLEGFGIIANVGYTKTNIEPNGPGSSQPIPGFSKWTPQGTFFYEKDGFSARVSVSHRSKFVAEVRGFGESRDFRFGKAETLVDAQVSYEFQDGTFDGLSILLQGYNLTDEPFITFDNNDPRQIINYQEFGSRYLLGVSYRF